MKNLIKIQGIKLLDKPTQKTVNGGKAPVCPPPLVAMYNPVTHRWSCC